MTLTAANIQAGVTMATGIVVGFFANKWAAMGLFAAGLLTGSAALAMAGVATAAGIGADELSCKNLNPECLKLIAAEAARF